MAVQSTTSTSSIDPALLPYLTQGLERAKSLFLTGKQPQFFPGQTYVSPSAATTESLSQQEALARQQSQVLGQAQQAFMGGLTAQSQASPLFQNVFSAAQQPGAGSDILRQTAEGGFLNANPYQQQMIQAATRPIEQQFSQSVLPGIASLYSKSGRLGSGSMERALGTATEGFGRALGDVSSNIAGAQFQAERGLQQQAAGALGAQQQAAFGTQLQAAGGLGQTQAQDLSRQLQASLAAPQVYGQQFLPSQTLAQVGAQREAIASQPLQEQMTRYAFQQRLPYEQLSGFLSSVYGSPLGSYGTQVQQLPQSTNRTTGALSGALAGGLGGYALGQAFPSIGSFGGGFGAPAAGAALGGLLGYGF
jgi:hypothetical protein